MNLIFVVLSGDRIIGVDGSIFKRIKIGNRVSLGTFGTDMAVHPDFRRRGVSNLMHDFFLEYIENNEDYFSYWATEVDFLIEQYKNEYSLLPNFLRSYIRICDMGLHNRINPAKTLLAYAWKLGLHFIKLLNDVRNILFPSQPVNKDIQVSEISEFDVRVDTFWDDVKDHYDFIVERTREHLNWNYCDPRGGNFIVKLAEENGRMLGYIVLKRDEGGVYPRGEVVDLLIVPGRMDVAEALLAEAIRFFDGNGINACSTSLLEGHAYEKVFKRHGFFKVRRKMHVFYYCPVMDEEFKQHIHETFEATDAERVHLFKGDLL